ncbi:MAG: hypothetical protein Ct9H300mP8_06210 [Gammaproteobacteria bacterium]|nr:MAG: hypothetical protein Ct9H300mP8_06210 [Gammaproteobacteria bacterium]
MISEADRFSWFNARTGVHETVNFIVSRNDAVVYRVRRHRLDAGSDGGMTDSLEWTSLKMRRLTDIVWGRRN